MIKIAEKFISSKRDTPTFTAYLICIIPFFTDESDEKENIFIRDDLWCFSDQINVLARL